MRRLPIVAGIAIGLATMLAGCATSTGTGVSSADAAFYGGTIVVTAADGHSTLPLAKIDEIKQVAGVRTAFATYRFDARTGAVEPAGVMAAADSIVASDPTEAAWSSLKTSYAEGHAIDADSSGEVVLGSAIAQEFKKTIGDTVDLPINPSSGAATRTFKVVGILNVTHTGPDQFAGINITDGQLLLKDSLPATQRDQVDVAAVATAIDVYAKPGTSVADLDKIAGQINAQVVGVKAFKPSEVVAGVKP